MAQTNFSPNNVPMEHYHVVFTFESSVAAHAFRAHHIKQWEEYRKMSKIHICKVRH